MKAHDAIVRLLAAEGVETIFTLMSEDTMRLMSKLETEWEDRVRMIKTRHEQGAVAMADAYARTADGVGMCLVGRGPAVAQTGTAMVTARKKGSKLLVLAPESPLSDEYDIKAFDQEAYLRSTVGNVLSIRSPKTLVSEFREALRRVNAGDCPLAVQVPWDVFDGEIDVSDDDLTGDGTAGSKRPSNVRGRVRPDDEAIWEAVELYLDSDAFRPPIVLAGRGAVRADAKAAVEAFAERTSALLATTLQARNYFADHPFYLGFTGEWGSNLANRRVAESDLVVAVGASLNPYTVDEGHVIGDETTVIHIDADPASIGRHTDADLGIHGDARLTIEALTRELEREGIDREGELWTDDLRRRIEDYSPMNDREFPDAPGTVDPRELVETLDRILPADRKVTVDGGQHTRWVMDGIRTPPENFTFTLDFASIGLGLPMGIGTSVAADDRPCVAVCGDAGFMMSLQELETAARNEVPITVVVFNDGSLGSEYHSLDVAGHAPEVARVGAPDFAEVARSFGADGYTVRSVDDLAALSDELGRPRSGPLVVDCKVNHEVRHRSKM